MRVDSSCAVEGTDPTVKAWNAALFASLVVGVLMASHLLMVAYIAYHDLRGEWDAYRLKAQRNTAAIYLSHAPSFFADMLLLLWPSLFVYGYYYDCPLWSPLLLQNEHLAKNVLRVALILVSSVMNNVINRLWAMGVHYTMHAFPTLYKTIHKQHHTTVRELCALSSWQDSATEFFVMEVFGTFLLASLVNPLPVVSHVILACYNGVFAAIDHSGFYIPGTWIDGRYHWNHHVYGKWNFSEIKELDKFFGTLLVWGDISPKRKQKRAMTTDGEARRNLASACET